MRSMYCWPVLRNSRPLSPDRRLLLWLLLYWRSEHSDADACSSGLFLWQWICKSVAVRSWVFQLVSDAGYVCRVPQRILLRIARHDPASRVPFWKLLSKDNCAAHQMPSWYICKPNQSHRARSVPSVPRWVVLRFLRSVCAKREVLRRICLRWRLTSC